MFNQKERLTKEYLEFIEDRFKDIPCLGRDVPLTMENYIPLKVGEESKDERLRKGKEEKSKETRDYMDFRVWREEQLFGEIHSLTPVDVERAIQNKKRNHTHLVIETTDSKSGQRQGITNGAVTISMHIGGKIQ